MSEQDRRTFSLHERILARSKRERFGMLFVVGLLGTIPGILVKSLLGEFAGWVMFVVWMTFHAVFTTRFFGVHPQQQMKPSVSKPLLD